MPRHPSDPDQSVLRIGEFEIRYYVREPSPDRWNAVGVIVDADRESKLRTSIDYRMIVGVGSSRDEAIGDLIARVVGDSHPLVATHRRAHLPSRSTVSPR
jgi:hypothetical protein